MFKSLIGIIASGAGAIVPIAKATSSLNSAVVDSSKNLFGSINKDKALGELTSKGCKLVKNSKTNEVWFDALWICKESGDKATFYYLDKSEEFKKDLGLKTPKKISFISYLGESNNSEGNLSLTLEGGEKKIIDVGVVWKYFNNTKANDVCQFFNPKLGGEMLQCKLTEAKENGSPITYIFSAF